MLAGIVAFVGRVLSLCAGNAAVTEMGFEQSSMS